MNPSIPDEKLIIQRVETAIAQIKSGGMVIMVDDEDRENEGDLVLAAEHATAEHINFMAKEARGLICLTLEPGLVDRLKLPMMGDSTKNLPSQGTAFTVSIEAREGVTTGISAADRAHTILTAIADDTAPDDIVVPGHIFPLKARSGGILERAGHTEGSVDIAKMAGLKGGGVICEIMNDDGTMARMPDLEAFANKHKMPIVAIADLIHYRLIHDSMIEVVDQKTIKTTYGEFEAVSFRSLVDQSEHVAVIKGDQFDSKVVDVRVHSSHPLVDAIGDEKTGGRKRIDYGIKLLTEVDAGVFVYLSRQSTSACQDLLELADDVQTSKETRPARAMDLRLHGLGAQILRHLGIKRMRIHTRSPVSLKGLSGFGLEIVDTHIMD
jgi:3,4-dihydroxy 2-butanone 4-phosphate synthase/GTP cyclohydrolase II